MIKLSILIPTLSSRQHMFEHIYGQLNYQIGEKYKDEVEVLYERDNGEKTIGEKRNILMQRAKGEWVAMADDDDTLADYYIEEIMNGLETNPDCCSLIGEITTDGKNPKTFIHSLDYTSYFEEDNIYRRCPNHLNVLRRSLAIQIPFPQKNFSEDTDFALALCKSGLLKTEYKIDKGLYYYRYISKKTNKVPYSQSLEENFILDYFKNQTTGKFIDIGAYDVFRFSNTRALYEKGFKGIFVEPQPQNYKSIADHYAGDKEIQVLNIAVGEPEGEIDFYESNGDAVGTTDIAHKNKWAAGGVKYTKIKVRQMGVASFFNTYCRDIDFLSIDTESTNITVFRNIPDFVFEQIKMICIEHDGKQQEIEERLQKFNFNTLYVNSENILMAK